MSEDFLFTDGTNPSALLDILDEDEADVNTSLDVDKILAKFIEVFFIFPNTNLF